MTPGARIQAAIDCLDVIFDGAPAEKTLTGWARRSRFAGSKDRAAVRDHVFDALRCRDSYAAMAGDDSTLSARSVMLGLCRDQNLPMALLFSGEGHAPQPLSDEEQVWLDAGGTSTSESLARQCPDMQAWCFDKLQSAHPETAVAIAKALTSRAPVDLRANLRKASVAAAIAMLADDGVSAQECDVSNTALRIVDGARKVKNTKAYLDGFVELQDAGSQALIEALIGQVQVQGSTRILDFCAGGGGKSLALAAHSGTTLFAHDANAARMKDIPERARRAGVVIERLARNDLAKKAPFDLTFCDVPCSGSGAWRRSPDAKWRLSEAQFSQLIELQSNILSEASVLVRPGGILAYATCSLFSEENEDQVTRFLKSAPEYEKIRQLSWSPLDGCDGFHLSILHRAG